jgi:hypothetical protein
MAKTTTTYGIAVGAMVTLVFALYPMSAMAGTDLDFSNVRIPITTQAQIMPAAGDLYGAMGAGDGWTDLIGARNDGTGRLIYSPAPMLFPANRENRDYRVADLNGDGLPDIVTNTYDYPCSGKSGLKVFMNDGTDNNGQPIFHEDESINALNINGHGETIVVADFDNSGTLQIFLPYYTFAQYPSANSNICADGPQNVPQNYLLKLGPNGWYSVPSTGLEMRGWPASLRQEGAQALDIDGDGLLDLYVASHLFLNQGGLRFIDVTTSTGLAKMLCDAETEINRVSGNGAICTFTDDNGAPAQGMFDEGAKFVDWYNNGHLSLVLHHPTGGPVIFDFDGTQFTDWKFLLTGSKTLTDPQGRLITPLLKNSFGMNAYDLDNDGRDDVVVAGGDTCNNAIFMNKADGARRATVRMGGGDCYAGYSSGSSGITLSDINRDGRMDIVLPLINGSVNYFLNSTPTASNAIKVMVLGENGWQNQFGRMVQISPVSDPSVVFTRVVDGGSGYLSQTPYTINVGTPYFGPHTVKVYYAGGVVSSVVAYPGQLVEVYPNQAPYVTTTSIGVMPAPKATPAYKLGVYRPTTSTFYLRGAAGEVTVIPYGAPGDVPLIGDWDGDGVDTIGIYRPSTSTFFLRNDNSPGFADVIFPMGAQGDIPVAGDWQGLGKTSVGVYRPSTSTYYLRTQPLPGATIFRVAMGGNRDLPLVGDWLGNGVPSIGVYRPDQSQFFERYCLRASQTSASLLFGAPGDIPVTGDWNGDGVVAPGVYRPSENVYYLRNSNTQGMADVMVPIGAPGDLPLVGRW